MNATDAARLAAIQRHCMTHVQRYARADRRPDARRMAGLSLTQGALTMQRIAAITPAVESKLAAAREGQRAITAAAIAKGVEQFGWSPDALCPMCGDRGQLPNSRRLCDCAAGRRAAILERDARAKEEREKRWRESGVPRRFGGYRLATAPNESAAAQVADWLDRRPADTGENLVIAGPVGSGKTGLAIGALWELHETSDLDSLRFVGCPALLDGLRPGGDETLLAACQRAGCLVLDDLGVTRGTDWEQERLYVLLNDRYEALRPTIVTTNATIADLSRNIGERTVSRLMEQARLVAVDGPDRRRAGGVA